MSQKIISAIGRSQRLEIVNLLKRSQGGYAVKELAEKLKMSYMGVKQHCLNLHKEGYLETWRRPRGNSVGRPQMAYRLTPQAHDLFPHASNDITMALLTESQTLFGSSAPEKLLYSVFERRQDFYQSAIKDGTLMEKATSLAKVRDKEGYMSGIEDIEGEGICIVEYHSLLEDLFEKYPIIKRLEEGMFSQVLDTSVQRTQESQSGLYRCVFRCLGE